jgi:hypothetical protein
MKRQEANLEICQLLTDFFANEKHRDVRFFQALHILNLFEMQYDDKLNVTGVKDPFSQESVKTLNIIKEKLAKL